MTYEELQAERQQRHAMTVTAAETIYAAATEKQRNVIGFGMIPVELLPAMDATGFDRKELWCEVLGVAKKAGRMPF